MRIGIPREVKPGERRVALVPADVERLVSEGNAVRVQREAGFGAGFSDVEYRHAGADMVDTAAEAYDAETVVKVKELQDTEWRHVRAESTLFGFLLLSAHRNVVHELRARRVTAIAGETVEDAAHRLPVLSPMSRISGALAVTAGAHYLATPQGRGIDIADARVVVLGAGSAGAAAATRAHALGANVSVLSRVGPRLATLAQKFGLDARTMAMTPDALMESLDGADLVIGAVNVPGAPTPTLIDRQHLRSMGDGAVLVDISIDGGGVAETSRATSHAEPVFVEQGVIHYMVPNIPAAVPRSASMAYSASVLPFLSAMARDGVSKALRDDAGLAAGAHLTFGQVTHRGLGEALGVEPRPLESALEAAGS
jgi:alanine dehydrogenase